MTADSVSMRSSVTNSTKGRTGSSQRAMNTAADPSRGGWSRSRPASGAPRVPVLERIRRLRTGHRLRVREWDRFRMLKPPRIAERPQFAQSTPPESIPAQRTLPVQRCTACSHRAARPRPAGCATAASPSPRTIAPHRVRETFQPIARCGECSCPACSKLRNLHRFPPPPSIRPSAAE